MFSIAIFTNCAFLFALNAYNIVNFAFILEKSNGAVSYKIHFFRQHFYQIFLKKKRKQERLSSFFVLYAHILAMKVRKIEIWLLFAAKKDYDVVLSFFSSLFIWSLGVHFEPQYFRLRASILVLTHCSFILTR